MIANQINRLKRRLEDCTILVMYLNR